MMTVKSSTLKTIALRFIAEHEKSLPILESKAREWYTKKHGEYNRTKFIKNLRGRGGVIKGDE